MPRRNTIEVVIKGEDQASPVLNQLGLDVKKFAKIAIGALGFGAVVAGAKKATTAMFDLAKAAAPIQLIERAFTGLAQSVGSSADEMLGALRDASMGMIANRDLMKSFNQAAQLVSRDFAVLLPDAMQSMAKIAAATGEDMNFLLDSFVRGVGRASPMILDNLQVQIDATAVTEQYAKSIGKTTEQLTKQETQMALANETIKQMQINTAAMPDITGTAQFEFARFTTTMQNFKDEVGGAVLPVLANMMRRFNAFVNNVMPPVVNFIETKLAPAFDLIVDKLGGLSADANEAGQAFVKKFGGRMAEAAENALRWGVKISTELATGLIKGAVAAINAAMIFIGNMLSSWLGPGSPPKVAPDIGVWGAEAFTEYLTGFGDAEFDVLEGLQGPLQSALSALVDMGELGAEDALPLFKELTFGITEAIDEFKRTGVVGTEIFDRLRAAGGQFGDELAELARRQLALAAATDEVMRAEENLAAAREAQERAQQTVDELADEFNRLLAAGADPAILKTKKAEFNEAKKQLALSKKSVKEAEKQEKQAKKQLDPLKGQVNLQEKLLQQLFDFAKVRDELTEKEKKAKKEKEEELTLPPIPIPVLEAPDFSAVDASFDEAKAGLAAKFSDIFSPMTEAWTNEVQPALEGLGNTWTWFTGIIQTFWDEKVQPVVDKFLALIPPGLVEKFGEIAGAVVVAKLAFAALGIAVGIVTGLLGTLLSPIGLIVLAIAALALAWETNFLGIRDALTTFWEDTAKPALEGLALWLGENIPIAMQALSDFWTNTLEPVFVAIGDWLEVAIPVAIEALRKAWEDVLKPALVIVWEFIRDDLLPLFEDIKELFNVALTLAINALAGLWEKTLEPAIKKVWELVKDKLMPIWDDLMKKFEDAKIDILDPLKKAFDKVGEAIKGVRDFINGLIERLKAIELPDWMSPGSPTPWELGIRGISAAMRELSEVEIPRLETSFGNLNQATERTGPVTNNNFNMTVNTQAETSSVLRDFATLTALAT